jgi:hypothetical protein
MEETRRESKGETRWNWKMPAVAGGVAVSVVGVVLVVACVR